MKKYFKYSALFLFLVIVFTTIINFYVLSFSSTNYYFDVNGLDKKEVGLVFGASVKSNGQPSDILKDRLKVAIKAYNAYKIDKIIVSGDNSKNNYNEPVAMQKYLMKYGVKKDDIYLDYAGFDTYDSLYRARDVFGVNELVLFTQDFHLKRAMYIASKLGIKVYGVETNLQRYIADNYNKRREVFARVKAFLEVDILKVEPTYLGDKIKIIKDEEVENAKKEILEK